MWSTRDRRRCLPFDARLRLSELKEVIGELEALLAGYPTREHPAGHLVLALYRTGRQADALEV